MTQPGRAAHGYAGQIELGIERGIVDGVLDLSKHVGWKMSFSAKLVSFITKRLAQPSWEPALHSAEVSASKLLPRLAGRHGVLSHVP